MMAMNESILRLWRNVTLFNKWFWGTWLNYLLKNQTGLLLQTLTPYYKRSSKWIKDLNVGPKTIKLLKGSLGSMLSDISLSNILEGASPQAREKNISKWGLLELKSFCTAKKTVNKVKRQLTEWEKIFANYI